MTFSSVETTTRFRPAFWVWNTACFTFPIYCWCLQWKKKINWLNKMRNKQLSVELDEKSRSIEVNQNWLMQKRKTRVLYFSYILLMPTMKKNQLKYWLNIEVKDTAKSWSIEVKLGLINEKKKKYVSLKVSVCELINWLNKKWYIKLILKQYK